MIATASGSRRLLAAALAALAVAAGGLVVSVLAYFVANGFTVASLAAGNGFYSFTAVAGAVLLFVALVSGLADRAPTALAAGAVAGAIGAVVGGALLVLAQHARLTGTLLAALFEQLLGFNLLFWLTTAVALATYGRIVYRLAAATPARGRRRSRVAFVRLPADSVADGITREAPVSPVDTDRADAQWDAYVAALRAEGWRIEEVEPAERMPDSVFVEDAAVVVGDLAVLTRPGAESRRGEVDGVADALTSDGYEVVRIEEPATLDGGDVLQVGSTVYVGRSDRTNAEGVRQLRALLGGRGRTVVAVPVPDGVLHLKSAVTALPDGTVLGHPPLAPDPATFDRFLAVPEPGGAHVVALGDDVVLMAASAPRSAELVRDLGYRVVTVEIDEFEKLDGSVTCLSVRGL